MGTVAGLKVGQGRRLYVSATKQSAAGSAATLTNIVLHPLESGLLEPIQEQMLSTQYSSGSTSDHIASHIPVGYRVAQQLTTFHSVEWFGISIAKALNGSDSASVNGSIVEHALTASTDPNYLVMMTMEEHLAGGTNVAATDRKLLDLSVDSFELNVPKTGHARINLGLLGSGRQGTLADITESGLVQFTGPTPAPKFRFTLEANAANDTTKWSGAHAMNATAGLFPAVDGTATDISSYIDNFSFRWLNNATDDKEVGSSTTTGLYAGQFLATNRRCEVEFSALYGTGLSTLLHSMTNSTTAAQGEYTGILNCCSDTTGNGYVVVFPVMALESTPSGFTGGGPIKGTFKFVARRSTANQPIVVYTYDPSNVDYN